jgi:hypothetical protein
VTVAQVPVTAVCQVSALSITSTGCCAAVPAPLLHVGDTAGRATGSLA